MISSHGQGDTPHGSRPNGLPLGGASPTASVRLPLQMLYSNTGLYSSEPRIAGDRQHRQDFMDLGRRIVLVFLWTDRHPVYLEYDISPLNQRLQSSSPISAAIPRLRPWHTSASSRERRRARRGPKESRRSIQGWRPNSSCRTTAAPLQNVPPSPAPGGGPTLPHGSRRWQATHGTGAVGPSFHEYEKFGDLFRGALNRPPTAHFGVTAVQPDRAN